VYVVNELYTWTDLILFYGAVVLRVWALVDCASRKAAAFPAVNKLTKPAWLTILVISGFLGSYFGQPDLGGTLSIWSLVSTTIAAVYLADVRPAVREITGGR